MKKRFIAMLLVVAQLMMLTMVAAAADGPAEDSSEAGLRFRYMSWDEENECICEDPSTPLMSRWDASVGSGAPVKFYFVDDSGETFVELSQLTFSEHVEGNQYDNHDYIDIQAVAIGEGSISYTSGSTTYSLPVTVELPDFGFYSSTTASEDTYLSFFKVTGTENTFYFVANEECTLTDVTLLDDFDQFADADKVSDTCWEITVTGTPEDNRWYEIRYSGTDREGNSFSDWGNDIRIINGIPGLRFVRMWEDNGQWQEDEQARSWSELQTFCGSCDFLRLYYGAGDELTEVSEVSLTRGSDVVRLTEWSDSNGPFYQLEYLKCGTAQLSYTIGGQAYTQDITVVLPDMGFYSAQVRDEEHYLTSPAQYRDLADGVLWLLREGGFAGDAVQEISLDGDPVDWDLVPRDDEGAAYDVKITLPGLEIGDWRELRVLLKDGEAGIGVSDEVWGKAGYVDNYAIGFSLKEESSGIIRINEGDWRTGNGNMEVNDDYSEFRTLQIAAGIRKTDEQGAVYYEVEENSKKVGLTVIRAWVEELSGTPEVFSFAQDGYVDTKNGYTGIDVTLYARQGYDALIRLWAEVEVTVGNNAEPVTVEVSVLCETNAMTQVVEYRPDNDTVETLNAYLQSLSEHLEAGCVYQIHLAPTVYEGTVVIPSNFEAGPDGSELLLYGTTTEDGSATTILRGAVNLNRSTTSYLNDIHFKATNDCRTAVYGGALLNMCGCSFEGYDIAVDASVGTITVTSDNVFVRNSIAVRMDIASHMGGSNSTAWERNTFLNNGTAIQILSLNDFISSYYFRIVDSNFIGNATDFDVQCTSTLYMYRNYYGNIHNQAESMEQNAFLNVLSKANTETKLNQLVTSNSPNISCNHSITKVITNPRWKYPVLNWWRCPAPIELVFPVSSAQPSALDLEGTEESYTNILVSDWNLATQIVNEEAGDLIVDPSAFETEGEKQIDVVDRDENPLGTWTFDKEEN